MVDIIPLDPDHHLSDVLDLTEDYLSWIAGEVLSRYGIDAEEAAGMTVPEYARIMLGDLSPYVPPNGLFCVVVVEGAPVGMGALTKLDEGVGTIRRMYIRPEDRGRGYGKVLLDDLTVLAKEFGCSTIFLETGQFMEAAQHIYRAAGFVERPRYPEVETPPQLQPYWICMERVL
jgi:GNAT superfamily N-acetyltransferase